MATPLEPPRFTVSTPDATAPACRQTFPSGAAAQRQWDVAAAIVWAVCVCYAAAHLRHGWVPFDAGALGQSAERVLAGQLPHRDFDSIYTGGLSYLHAAAFRLLGPSVLAMRITLLAAFALWLPAVYGIARRVATRPLAIAAVLLATAWSIPVYPEAMPSWYNLFLATFGVLAVLRYLDDLRRRWLFAAGVCAALSCLVKVTGLYFAGAVLLFLAYHEQERARAYRAELSSGRLGSLVLTLCLIAFNALILALVWHAVGPNALVQFVLPAASLSALLVWREWRAPGESWPVWLSRTARLVLPLAAGFALPIALWLVPYLATHSLGALAYGVFVLPSRRMRFTSLNPVGALGFVVLAVEGALILHVARRQSERERLIAEVVIVAACVAVPFAATAQLVYQVAWLPMRVLVPLVAVGAAYYLMRREQNGQTGGGNEAIFLLASAAAVCGLVQFPFAAPVYFFYVGPLAALAVLALAARGSPRLRRLACAGALAYTLFATLRIHPASVTTMGTMFVPDHQTHQLSLARGGVLVKRPDSTTYALLVRELRMHSRSGYTYAGPDCPEIYFLSGLLNPTRTLFDFFDEQDGRTARILGTLDVHGVTAIVINLHPDFSGLMPADLLAALDARYPYHESVGPFIVRWRE